MSKTAIFIVLVLVSLVSASQIRRYAQESDRSNQYLVWDDDDTAILFDTGNGDATETQDLINFITSQGVTSLNTIFITHGQADSFGGVPLLSEQYPSANIEVANDNVKMELLNAVSVTMPYSTFDWDAQIDVHDDDEFFDELDLILLDEGFPAAETEYYAMIHNADDNWIITGDALFIDAHPYLGATVDIERLRNWYSNTLVQLSLGGRLGLDVNTIYYPGHGKVGDYIQVDVLIEYLLEFEDLLLSCPNVYFPRTLEAVRINLIESYPAFEIEEILDFMVSNPAWLDAQEQDDPCAIIQEAFYTSSDATALYVSMMMVLLVFALL